MQFMALGGTDQIGASCYYLSLAGRRFLLDCGCGLVGKRTYTPDYGSLLRADCGVYSLSQLDAIFLSHGHFDHLGALPLFTELCSGTPVYATALTKELGGWLLWDNYPRSTDFLKRFHSNLQSEAAIRRIHTVGCGKPLAIGGIRITFFEAGHIPGAAMIYFESMERNVLYTGDFMEAGTYLTAGYCLPDTLKPDVVILCGTHAKHPAYRAHNWLASALPGVKSRLRRGRPAYISTKQLTKGVETVRFLEEECPETPLYLSEPVWSLAEQMGWVGIPVLRENCYRDPAQDRLGVHIGHYRQDAPGVFNVDFSLHAGYTECVRLLQRCQPSVVFVVHSPSGRREGDDSALSLDCPDVAFFFPQQGHLYADA